MPQPLLSDVEQDLVDAGLCACGCGARVERPAWGYSAALYATAACRARTYRRRSREGRVVPARERGRERARKQLDTARRRVVEVERLVKHYQGELRDLRTTISDLEAIVDPRQALLPVTARPERVEQLDPGDVLWQLLSVPDVQLLQADGLSRWELWAGGRCLGYLPHEQGRALVAARLVVCVGGPVHLATEGARILRVAGPASVRSAVAEAVRVRGASGSPAPRRGRR
ncbi:hypothetical protein L6R53_14135 [Myxococcota bacterium]|nr:hypothetical protein [Myxococcota bacterium]